MISIVIRIICLVLVSNSGREREKSALCHVYQFQSLLYHLSDICVPPSTIFAISHSLSKVLVRYAMTGTFAHEVGHNFGCYHSRYTSENYPGFYSFAWQDPSSEFRTIMAYTCRYGASCPRIQYYSNTIARYNGKVMGNADNDCARKHNEIRTKLALYRTARITLAPTISPKPTEAPTQSPTMSPTKSDVPSLVPSSSSAPSGAPSEWPTFNTNALSTFLTLDTPRTTLYQARKGVMFDITAKGYDITVHNFRLPFLNGGDFVVSIWSRTEEGSFWYDKNNEDAWTFLGSPSAYSPGMTLEDPIPLPLQQRPGGGVYYG